MIRGGIHGAHLGDVGFKDVRTVDLCAFITIVQGTWGNDAVSNSITGGYMTLTNSSNTDADEIEYYISLQKGNYTVRMNYTKGGNGAIVDTYFDGNVILASTDMYGSGYNQSTTDTFDVNISGTYSLKFKINGKNGASSGYKARIQSMHFMRT